MLDGEGDHALGTDLALHASAVFPSLAYRPRRPDQEALHQIVRDHYETFRAQAAGRRDGYGYGRPTANGFSRQSYTSNGYAVLQPDMLEYPGENHGLARPANQQDYTVRMKEFFDHFLKGAPAPDWWKSGVSRLDMQEHIDGRLKAREEEKKKRAGGGGGK